MKLPDLQDDLAACLIEGTHLLSEQLVALLEHRVQVPDVKVKVIVKLLEVLVEVLLEDLGHVTLVLGNPTATDVEAVVAEELVSSVDDVVSDQAIQADKELGPEVVLDIVDMS